MTARASSAAWFALRHLPSPIRRPAHAVVALGRRTRARATPIPDGPPPLLPATAIELPTRYGTFWFDGADSKMVPWIRRHATWEADVIRLLSSVVRPGSVVVDVGANIGFHTVVASELVGPGGRVHAFEPLPDTLLLLRANVWRHACSNVTIHPYAVSDHLGIVHLRPDPEGLSGAALADTGLEAEAVTLDEVLAGERVDVLKVDAEGAEPLVLYGAREVLAGNPRLTAVVEFRAATHLDGRAPADVLRLYRGLGLEPCLLRSDGNALPATNEEIIAAAGMLGTINIVLRA